MNTYCHPTHLPGQFLFSFIFLEEVDNKTLHMMQKELILHAGTYYSRCSLYFMYELIDYSKHINEGDIKIQGDVLYLSSQIYASQRILLTTVNVNTRHFRLLSLQTSTTAYLAAVSSVCMTS